VVQKNGKSEKKLSFFPRGLRKIAKRVFKKKRLLKVFNVFDEKILNTRTLKEHSKK
jgi:hypothetical protein